MREISPGGARDWFIADLMADRGFAAAASAAAAEIDSGVSGRAIERAYRDNNAHRSGGSGVYARAIRGSMIS